MIFETVVNNVIYKSINKGSTIKVLEYVIIDGKRVNSNEWNKEIGSEEELKAFAIKNEQVYI